MMESYDIDFIGLIQLYAFSKEEALSKFRKWIATAPGSVQLEDYDSEDEE